MKHLENILKENGFGKSDSLNSLKVTFEEKSDRRYAIEDGFWGFHISNSAYNELVWKNFLEYSKEIKVYIKVIYLARNEFENSFEIYEEDFPNLEYLNISENSKLTEVKFEYNLSNLNEINLSNCKSLSFLNFKGNYKSLKYLDASNCNFSQFYFPKGSTKLEFCNISSNQIQILKINEELPKLKHLYANKNFINTIDISVNLPTLDILEVDNKRLIFNSELKLLENELKDFQNLKYETVGLKITFLDLGNQALVEIPKNIKKFRNLEEINFGSIYNNENNQDIPCGGKLAQNDFSKAQHFNLLFDLPKLKGLHFNDCKLQNLEFLRGIPSLQILDLTTNPKIGGNLKELSKFETTLEKLFIGNNKLKSDELDIFKNRKFENLKLLSLRLNEITNIESLIELIKNDNCKIFLDNNKISDNDLLPFSKNYLSRFKWNNDLSRSVFISNNPINESIIGFFDIPDLKIKKQEFDKYFKLLDLSETIQIKKLKLILLGNTTVGKTTFFDIITGQNLTKDNKSTHGININTYTTKAKTKVQIFDFGGQDYYHSTHLPYFKNGAYYLLIWGNGQDDKFDYKIVEERNENLFPINYWLKSVPYMLKGNSDIKPKSEKICLLQNTRQGNIHQLNNKEIFDSNDLFNFSEFMSHNLLEIKNETNLKENFINLFEKLFDENSLEVGTTQIQLNFIEKLKISNKILISITEISEIIAKEEEFSQIEIMNFIDWADNTLDLAYPFQNQKDVAQILLNYAILDIQKFNQLIFVILEKGMDGYFNEPVAYEKLNQYFKKEKIDLELEPTLHYLIEYMKFYKIIFEIKNSPKKYIVPGFLNNLLNKTDELFIDTFDKPIVKYEFKSFFHGNIFSDVFEKFYDYLIQNDNVNWKYIVWKNKIILYEGISTQNKLLFIDFQWKQFEIKKEGPDREFEYKPFLKIAQHTKNKVSETFLKSIISQIDVIVKDFEHLKFVADKYFNYVPINEINDQNIEETNGKSTNLVIYNNKVFRKGDFKLFLNDEKLKMKKIFISYSKIDEIYKDELKKHLVTLQRQNLIDTFDDKDLELGEKWDNTLKHKIHECDYFICLVSVDFLNTDYIHRIELPLAMGKESRIIPIIIRPCDWKETPLNIYRNSNTNHKNIEYDTFNSVLGDFNAFSKGAIISLSPTFTSNNGSTQVRELSENERDHNWYEVVKKIRALIDKD